MRSCWLLPLSLVVLAGCQAGFLPAGSPPVRGSGASAEETRTVAEFTCVELQGVVAGELVSGDPPSVRLTADDNLLPLVETAVENGCLVIRPQAGSTLQPRVALKALVTCPRPLENITVAGASTCRVKAAMARRLRLETQGAAQLTAEDLDADELRLDASGATTTTVKGEARSVRVEVSGASRVRLDELRATQLQVNFSGASRGEARASDSVEGEVSGASTLTLIGRPPKAQVAASGAASVTYREPR